MFNINNVASIIRLIILYFQGADKMNYNVAAYNNRILRTLLIVLLKSIRH